MKNDYLEEQEALDNAIKHVMRDAKGRHAMWWMLSTAGVFRTTFIETPSRAEYMALAMAHAEGRKDLGYRLLDKFQRICPEKYALLMKEHTQKE